MDISLILQKLKIQELNQMQKSTFETAKSGSDVVLLSPTGSGKTLAFLLPVLAKLKKDKKGIQTLIIVPARELALQIEQVFKTMGTDFKVTVAYGGHDKKTELNKLTEAPAVLIGTPGRICYHIDEHNIDPSTIRTLVLDEFDKSLEFGFKEQMGYIVCKLSRLNQRLLTSATAMDRIPDFTVLQNEKVINFLENNASKPEISFKKIIATSDDKIEELFRLICKIGNDRTLVFCNHREVVTRISELLQKKGIFHDTFHGAMEQDERERALMKFRNGSVRILLTTDLAARGLDIPEVQSIVHFQLPHTEDSFIHRNGRTARMNASGSSYLIMRETDQYSFLKDDIEIEKLEDKYPIPDKPEFETIYLSGGKKNKISKIDIVGFLLKKGELDKTEVGIIEVKETTSYAAVHRSKVQQIQKKLSGEKIKGLKIKIETAH